VTGGATSFDFSDVAKYPQLYAIEHRLDGHHLNSAGADAFTRALVERLLASRAQQQ
jgi:hypothetical protein